jgi:hypothetical protein
MKTTIITILTLSCSFLNAQKTDIKGKECKNGVGLCRIENSTNKSPSLEKFYLLKISETELQLTIKTNSLTIEDQKFLFGKEIKTITEIEKFYFNQDYDFELNSETIKLLELAYKNPTIKKGIYPIKLIEDRAIIILKIFNKI